MTPAWILDIFAAVMLVVAAVSAARLVALRPWRLGRAAVIADVDVAHLLMAIAMAGMLAAGLRTLPDGAWEVVFGVLTAWFGWQVLRDARREGTRALAAGHCAPHLVHAGAMLYMFLALTAPAASGGAGMSGMGGSDGSAGAAMATLSSPLLALLFALVLIGYSVWDLDRVSGPGAGGHYSLAAAVRPVPVLAGVPAGDGPDGTGPVSGLALAAVGKADGAAGTAWPDAADQGLSCAAPAGDVAITAITESSPVLAPWVATACRIAMGVTMAFMLIIMI